MIKMTSRDYADILWDLQKQSSSPQELDRALNHFLDLLMAKKQLKLLPAIVDLYQKKSRYQNKELLAQITTADGKIDPHNLEKIKKFVATKYPGAKKIIIKNKPAQPEIMSGFLVQVDDDLWNLSLQNQIDDFTDQLLTSTKN